MIYVFSEEFSEERLAKLYIQLKETAIEIERGKDMLLCYNAIKREIDDLIKILARGKRKYNTKGRVCKMCGMPLLEDEKGCYCDECKEIKRKEKLKKRAERNFEKYKERAIDGTKRDKIYKIDEKGNIIERKCSVCGEYKTIDHFYFIEERLNYYSRCKECCCLKKKQYRIEHRDEMNSRRRELYKLNTINKIKCYENR